MKLIYVQKSETDLCTKFFKIAIKMKTNLIPLL